MPFVLTAEQRFTARAESFSSITGSHRIKIGTGTRGLLQARYIAPERPGRLVACLVGLDTLVVVDTALV
jgi:hypothetical protein